MNTEVRGMQNPIGSTILRGKAAIEEVQALLTQLVQHDKDLANLAGYDVAPSAIFTVVDTLAISHGEVHEVVQRRRDSVVRLLENKSIMIRPDVENLTCGFTDHEGIAE